MDTANLILGIDDFAIRKGHTYNTGIHNLILGADDGANTAGNREIHRTAKGRELRSDSVNLIIEHVLSGALLIAGPPALPFYRDSHISMGFEPLIGIERSYIFSSGVQAAAYRLDTRGSKLNAFSEKTTSLRTENSSMKEHHHSARRKAEDSLMNRAFLVCGYEALINLFNPELKRNAKMIVIM